MATIKKLSILDSSLISSHVKIESFISAIHELILNAIASAATKISILIDWKSISVQIKDNGSGFDDLEMISKPHSADHCVFKSLTALGVISRLSIISKCVDKPSYILKNGVFGQYIPQEEDSGFFKITPIETRGSIVTVVNLYHALPIRQQTTVSMPPLRRLYDLKTMLVYTLMDHLDVELSVEEIHNHSISNLLTVTPRNSYQDLINQIFGKGIISTFETINASSKDIHLSGIISHTSSQSNLYQFISLNSRPFRLSLTKCRQLNKLFDKIYPVFLLSVKSTSVNEQDDNIFDLVCKTIISYLSSQNETVKITSLPSNLSKSLSPQKLPSKRQKLDDNTHLTSPTFNLRTSSLIPKLTPNTDATLSKQDLKSRNFQVINQIDSKFILISMIINQEVNLIIIDQHAADERIWVEKFFNLYLEEGFHSVELSAPICFEITDFDSQFFYRYDRSLRLFGVEFCLSLNKLHVTHLPSIAIERLANHPAINLDLLKYLYDLFEYKKLSPKSKLELKIPHFPKFIIDSINSKACQSAVKFGDSLTQNEMEVLVTKLFSCQSPFQCAHGRPTMIPIMNLNEWKEGKLCIE